MRKSIFIITIVFFFSSCVLKEADNVGHSIIETINNEKDSVCIIKLEDLTKFVWDSVYIFALPSSLDFIENKIATKYKNYEEFSTAIIFLNKGDIVHYENKSQSMESLEENQIVIGDLMDSTKCHVFTTTTAIFKGSKKTFENTTYYELLPSSKDM